MSSTHTPILSRQFSTVEVSTSYARVAWFYDLWSHLTEAKAAHRVLALADIHDGDSVIEVAAGTGITYADLLRRNPHGLTEGVDLSSAMLRSASRKSGAKTGSPLSLVQASTYQLPNADQSFDVLLNSFMLDLLPESDFVAVLTEFRRVLKPGGRVVIATFGFGTRFYHQFWYGVARVFPALLTGCRPVRLDHSLAEAGFDLLHKEQVSQNTFPSTIYKAAPL